MQGAFGTVIIVVSLVALVIALFALASSGRTWSEYGKGMVMDRDRSTGTRTPSAEREEDTRALIAARNARRARRGLPPLDEAAELARLSGAPATAEPDVDPGLREEVRQLVVARNSRRIRAGKSPLDVEAELARELRRVADM